MDNITEHDRRMHFRCPRLGGEVPFKYCRTMNQGLFCNRILECWLPLMDIVAFLKANYDAETIARGLEKPQGRIDIMTDTLKKNPRSDS